MAKNKKQHNTCYLRSLYLTFFQVVLYVVFIAIMIRIYTLPLFAVRPMYLTMRAFKKAFNDVILSRRAINNMNMYYPDATEEELANTDNVCIICR
jgi:E3 ubiquitin-protein ligase synoviolin